MEVARQRKSCRIAGNVLRALKDYICPGLKTTDIDDFCGGMLSEIEGESALNGYRGYRHNICTSVNHVAAHGVPGDYTLQDGDIVTVDITVLADGWYGDSAWTYAAGNADVDSRRLIKAAWRAMIDGIKSACAGNRFGDIGESIENAAKRYGCSVLDNFVGHGIGRDMHEEPMVLNTGTKDTGLPIVPGMVFTVEPILCLGAPEVHALNDGWSVVTKDSSRCAQFEQTVAVFGNRSEILTFDQEEDILALDFPPFI